MKDASNAQWTLHPITEREIALERRQARRAKRVNGTFVFVLLAAVPVSCLGVLLDRANVIFLLIVLMVLAVLGIEKGRRLARGDQRRSRRRSMERDYSAVEGWLSEISVMQGMAITGRDRGMLWFEDGRLFFTGERTSFGLVADQVERELHEPLWLIPGLTATFAIPLRTKTAAGRASLGIDLLPLSDVVARNAGKKGFGKAYAGWIAQESEKGGQFPPLEIGPDAPTLNALFRAALRNTAFWILLVTAFGAFVMRTEWWLAPPVAALIGVLLVLWVDIWVPRLRWRSWADRRRLDETLRLGVDEVP